MVDTVKKANPGGEDSHQKKSRLCSFILAKSQGNGILKMFWGWNSVIWDWADFMESFPGGSVVKNQPANAGATGDVGLIARSGRSQGGGNGNPQNSCLENPMDRGAWRATVHRVTKSWTQLSDWAHTHRLDKWGVGGGGAPTADPAFNVLPWAAENDSACWFS